MKNKVELRQFLLAQRLAISLDERTSAMERAFSHLQDHPLLIDSHDIACYFAQGNEFSCSHFISTIWVQQKNCFLPVLASGNKLLEFVHYQKEDRLRLNRYNILEPENAKPIAPFELDLVFMPLVGFDLQGNRLGMGGGYYDRTFQFIQKSSSKKPFLLGLAYDFQKVNELPNDPWDVRLDGVLTEEKLYIF